MLKRTSDRLIQYVKEEGSAYRAQAVFQSAFGRPAVVYLRVDVPSRPGIEEFAKDQAQPLREAVLRFSGSEFENLAESEELHMRATPLSRAERFKMLIDGFVETGRVIDSDEVVRRHGTIDPDSLKVWTDKLLGVDPAIIVVGDLSK